MPCWAAGAAPLSGARLSLRESQILTEPNLPMTLGKLAAPTEIRVRSGVQGVDYMRPNAFFTAALPRAQFCAVDLIY